MKSLVQALQKENISKSPQKKENFLLGIGKGKGKPTKKKKKGNSSNKAAEQSVGHKGKYLHLIGAS